MDALNLANNRYLDYSVLASFAPNLINRDESGRPKTVMYAGTLRLSPSGQAIKRPLRRGCNLMDDKIYRTSYVPAVVRDRLAAEGITLSLDDVKVLSTALYATAKDNGNGDSKPGKTDDNRAKGKTNGIILVSETEIATVTTVVKETLAKGPMKDHVALGKDLKMRLTQNGPVDERLYLSLFGRMITNSPLDAVPDGALMVARGISVQKVTIHSDYFVAVEDLKEYREDAGAAMIDNRYYSSGVMILLQYRIDLDMLCQNAGLDPRNLKKTEADALRALILSISEVMMKRYPAAGQGSFLATPWASYAMCRYSNGAPFDLAGAFEQPISPVAGPITEQAVTEIKGYEKRFRDAYQADYLHTEFEVGANTLDTYLGAISSYLDSYISGK